VLVRLLSVVLRNEDDGSRPALKSCDVQCVWHAPSTERQLMTEESTSAARTIDESAPVVIPSLALAERSRLAVDHAQLTAGAV
jgi:hypothetical protein